MQIPTSTDGIAPNQWGAGITGVALKQADGWKVGVLANHVWSIGKSEEYGDSSNSFLQPFLSYTTKQATSFAVNTEAVYNWETEGMDGPDQHDGLTDHQDRWEAGAAYRRRTLLG